MVNDLLGGLVKGLSSVLPQDDPEIKQFNAQNELKELQKQETELFASIGKEAVEKDGIARFGSVGEKLNLIQLNIKAKQQEINELAENAEQAKAETKQNTCSSCGAKLADGAKFCPGCGAKAEATSASSFCPECGEKCAPGVKFCGTCGHKF